MTGEHKFLVIVVSLALMSMSLVLMVTLFLVWEQREWIVTIVGLLLMLFFMASIGVWVTRQLNEQYLRRKRVLYQQELPLDQDGQPYYIPGQMQPYKSSKQQRHREPKHEPLYVYEEQQSKYS